MSRFRTMPEKQPNILNKSNGKSQTWMMNDPISREDIPLQNGNYRVDDSPFTMVEVEYVLNKIKITSHQELTRFQVNFTNGWMCRQSTITRCSQRLLSKMRKGPPLAVHLLDKKWVCQA